jgi:glycosyltransferase involved in cell wall biosynthesis
LRDALPTDPDCFVAPPRAMTPNPGANSLDISGPAESPGHIIYDGLNLTPDHGAATYRRLLTSIARTLGYDVGVIYDTAFTPDKDPLLQEVLFFDQMRAPHELGRKITLKRRIRTIVDQLRYNFMIKALPLRGREAVVSQQYADALTEHDRAFIGHNILNNSNLHFECTAHFVNMSFDPTPDILHCTFPMPLRVRSACNTYTIKDLSSLRLPLSTVKNRQKTFRLLKKIADTADHIVTVSETVKRDIVHILKVDDRRVTNTYQAVTLPQKYLARSERAVANYLDGLYHLEMDGYLIFITRFESKNSIDRLIRGVISSGINIPMVLVLSRGFHDLEELYQIIEHGSKTRPRNSAGLWVLWSDYVGLSSLVNLLRGARAVVFPSLREDCSVPVLEAMMLGTPVVASTSPALSEISGNAALLVDPCDAEKMARAIKAIVNDADLRRELGRRGAAQAAKFSLPRYRERVRALYASLA